MEDQKLTDWYPPEVKPVREGVYEVTSAEVGILKYAYWNGKAFGLRCRSVENADLERESFWFPHEGVIHWRGLAEKPVAK